MPIVIVEDKPWKMKTSIKKLKKKGIPVEKVLYFCNNDNEFLENKDKVEQNCKEIEVEYERLTNYDFDDILETFYKDKGNLFLFDVDLIGDFSVSFENRINIKYAMKKRKNDGSPSDRIWFYTTGTADTHEKLNIYFPKRTIDAPTVEERQIILDYNMVEEVIKTYEEKCRKVALPV